MLYKSILSTLLLNQWICFEALKRFWICIYLSLWFVYLCKTLYYTINCNMLLFNEFYFYLFLYPDNLKMFLVFLVYLILVVYAILLIVYLQSLYLLSKFILLILNCPIYKLALLAIWRLIINYHNHELSYRFKFYCFMYFWYQTYNFDRIIYLLYLPRILL